MECANNIKILAEQVSDYNEMQKELARIEREEKIKRDTIHLCETTINDLLIHNAKRGIKGCEFRFAYHWNGKTIGVKKRNATYKTPNIFTIVGEYDLDLLVQYLHDNCYDTCCERCGIFKTYTGKYKGDTEYVLKITPKPLCE